MKMMFSCREVVAALSEIVDGEASRWTRFMFYMHLGMCGKCRLYYRQFKEMKAISEQVTTEDLPEDFTAVMQKTLSKYMQTRNGEEIVFNSANLKDVEP